MKIKYIILSALALICLSFATVKFMERNDLIPRKILFGNPDKRSVSLSPNAQYLAYLAPIDGVLNLWIAPREDMKKARAVTGDKERGVRSYAWAYDGKHIFFFLDEKGDENFRLYSYNIETSQTKLIVPKEGVRSSISGISHKKPGEILFSMNDRDKRYFDLYKLKLDDYSYEPVFINDKFSSIITDYDLNIRFALLVNPSGDQEYFKYKEDGSWEPFIKVSLEDSSNTGIEGFDSTGNLLYLSDSRDSDKAVLKQIDLTTSETKILASSDKGDVSIFTKHPTKKTVQVTETEYEKISIEILDDSVKEDFAYLQSISSGTLIINSRSLDDKYWIVAYLVDDGPIKYYEYNKDAKKANFLFTNQASLEKYSFSKMNPIIIKSRDGLDLVCYITFPKGTDGNSKKKLPMVLDVHGGPWARDSWGFDPTAQWLASRGYVVLNVNFRGSTGFGKSFANAGNGQWGKKMQEDLIDAVNFAIKEEIADPAKIAIMGGSYGGYATLVGMTMTPDLFACGIDIVGPSNLLTLINSVPPYWEPILSTFKKRIGSWDTELDRKALELISPLTFAGDIKKPLLIAQGANDPRVKQAESDQIVESMKKKNIPVLYALYEDEGHGFVRPENRLSFYGIVELFLAKNLGGEFQDIEDDLGGANLILNGKKTKDPSELSEIIEKTYKK